MGTAFGVVAFVYGLWRGPEADYSGWRWISEDVMIEDPWSFARVAYIHSAGYLGGLAGLIVALLIIRPSSSNPSDDLLNETKR